MPLFEQEVTELTEKSLSSPFSLFAPVEFCFSSVGSGQYQAVNTVGQFHLMEIDEQSKRDIQQFHVAQELCFVDG